MDTNALARKNLDSRLKPLQNLRVTNPPRGWLRAIRQSIGMTTEQLAKRLGVAQPRISALEKAEALGSVTLKTLREAAEALDCELVYALVPRTSLDDMLRRQIERNATADLAGVQHTMRLENQAVSVADLEDQRRKIVDAALVGSLKGVWNNE
jgi:predicted DNA-binding mobile mystery protein A